MAPGGGKQKGGSFERAVCKRLSLWITNGERDDVLWRSSLSGGRHTVARRKGSHALASAGDVSAIHSAGQPFVDAFLIECKHIKNLKLHGMLFPDYGGGINGFWDVLLPATLDAKRLPMLIAKQNTLPILVLLDDAGIDLLQLHASTIRAFFTYPGAYLVWFEDFLINAKAPGRKRPTL